MCKGGIECTGKNINKIRMDMAEYVRQYRQQKTSQTQKITHSQGTKLFLNVDIFK